MIKRYLKLTKSFFSLNISDFKNTIFLFLFIFIKGILLLFIPYACAKIIDYATVDNYLFALLYVSFFFFFSFAYVIAEHLEYLFYTKGALYTHKKIQDKVIKKIETFDEGHSKTMNTSFIIDTTINDVKSILIMPQKIFSLITIFITLSITIIIMFRIRFVFGFVALIIILCALFIQGYNLRKRDYYFYRQRKDHDNITSFLEQIVEASNEVKSFNIEDDIKDYLDSSFKSFDRNASLKTHYRAGVELIPGLVLGIGKILLYIYLIYLILNGYYNVSILILVIGYFENATNDVLNYAVTLDALSEGFTKVARLKKILNYQGKHLIKYGDNDNDMIHGDINFKNVSFDYEGQKIKNLSLYLSANRLYAIVGTTGSGKTSLFKMLLRNYKPNSGIIEIDGVNINEYTKDVYASNVSSVSQNPFIFNMTISDNLSLVDKSFANQVKACKMAGVHDYIMSLPKGYSTVLFNDGANLPNKERQQLVLARALLSRAEILLFDEITSSLDAKCSKVIMKKLMDLKKNHTILMITHNVHLMRMADEIIVLNKGKLVGRGTHKYLLKNNDFYKKIQG